MRKLYWRIRSYITQYIYRKKYGKFDIPVKNKNFWYFKQEVIYKSKKTIQIQKTDALTMHHFEEYTGWGLYFKYSYGTYKDLSEELIKKDKDFTHSHDFYQVLESVYEFPESFHIEKENEQFFSKDELTWIKKLQQQCLKDNLKDIGYLSKGYNYERISTKYNILELKKRNITKLYGINIKKHLKKYNNPNTYLEFLENYKINVFTLSE